MKSSANQASSSRLQDNNWVKKELDVAKPDVFPIYTVRQEEGKNRDEAMGPHFTGHLGHL